MSLDRLYEDGIEAGIQRKLANPGPMPEASFSVWSALGAGMRGPISGGLETLASVSDAIAAGGLGDMREPGSIADEPAEKARREEARKTWERYARALRRKADEFAPDPMTSSQADQIIHGLTRFMGKAVGEVGALGPVAGAGALALDEGNTTAQRLIDKGVDPKTAAKVGAVTGVVSGVGAVLPIAGTTVAKTLGLVAAGGPGGFMLQEGLSREILQRADYGAEAATHNPLDPLGLTLSTVVPGAFGAFGLRRAAVRARAVEDGSVSLPQMTVDERKRLKFDDARLDTYAREAAEREGVPPALLLAVKNAGERSNSDQVSHKGAQGVMQFMPATAREMGIADPTDPVQSIDGAARYLRKLFDAYGSWDAAVAHYNGGGSQAVLVRGGARPSFPETAAYLDRVRQYMAETTAADAAKSPEAVDAARVQVLEQTVARSLPDAPDAYPQMLRAADAVAAGQRIETEVASLGRAYDGVRANPIGPDDDPLVRLTPEGIGDVLVERGPNFPAAGDVEVKPGGYGLVKVIWKHGEGSNKAPENQVTREDVLALPEILRTYEPVDRMGGPASAADRDLRVVVDRPDGRRVVYAAARFAEDGESRVVTIHVDDRKVNPPSRQKETPSGRFGPDAFEASDAGTAAEPFSSAPAQRGGREVTVAREASNVLPDADSMLMAAAQTGRSRAQVPDSQGKGGAAADAPANTLDAQIAARLSAEQPDLVVTLPGSDERLTLADALARIKDEQKLDESEAQLLRAAADCALSP